MMKSCFVKNRGTKVVVNDVTDIILGGSHYFTSNQKIVFKVRLVPLDFAMWDVWRTSLQGVAWQPVPSRCVALLAALATAARSARTAPPPSPVLPPPAA